MRREQGWGVHFVLAPIPTEIPTGVIQVHLTLSKGSFISMHDAYIPTNFMPPSLFFRHNANKQGRTSRGY